MSGRAPDTDGGWLDSATRVESPNFDARPVGAEVDLVVIHAISLPPGAFGGPYIHQLFTNRLDATAHDYFREIEDARVSAHFVIDRAGVLTQFVDLRDRAWHAGASCWQGQSACNDYSLGIELEGCDEEAFTDAQYDVLTALLGELMNRYAGIRPERIVGHCDVAPGRKTDPGPHFDWARLRRVLSA